MSGREYYDDAPMGNAGYDAYGSSGGYSSGVFGDTSEYENGAYEYNPTGGLGGGMGGSLSGYGEVPTAGVGEYTDVDPRDLDPFPNLYPQGAGKVEFVGEDEGERGWGKKVIHQTAMAWVAGTALGIPLGAVEGFRQAPGSSAKLRMNSLLNGIGRRGPPTGNSLAAIALMYNCIEGGINLVSPLDTNVNGLAAGVASGLIYKSTAGARRMLVGGIGGGLLAAGFLLADHVAVHGLHAPSIPSLDALLGPVRNLLP